MGVPPVVVPVVAVLLILTLLLDEEGWVTVSVVLSWGATLSSGATGAPSGISTVAGETGAVIGLSLSELGAAYLFGCRAWRTLSMGSVGLLISSKWMLTLEVCENFARRFAR